MAKLRKFKSTSAKALEESAVSESEVKVEEETVAVEEETVEEGKYASDAQRKAVHASKKDKEDEKKEMSEAELKEFKADGEDSEIADPISTKDNSRPADKKVGKDSADSVKAEPYQKGGNLLSLDDIKAAPKRPADKTQKESVMGLFDGMDLAEDFQEKVSTIFEAAVIDRCNEVNEQLCEAYNAKLEEAVGEIEVRFEQKVDEHLSYVAEQWFEENQLAVENGIRNELAESFMSGLKTLFDEHYVDIPESKYDPLASMIEQNEELQKDLNFAIDKNIELANIIEEIELNDIFEDVADGLSESKREKLETLAGDIVFEDADQFRQKLSTIKEEYFSEKKTSNVKSQLDEEFDAPEPAKQLNPVMQSYMDAVSKTFRN